MNAHSLFSKWFSESGKLVPLLEPATLLLYAPMLPSYACLLSSHAVTTRMSRYPPGPTLLLPRDRYPPTSAGDVERNSLFDSMKFHEMEPISWNQTVS